MTENYQPPSDDYAKFFNIAGFEVTQTDASDDYGGSDSIAINGASPDGSFSVVFSKGCSPPGHDEEFETTTMYLDDLDVSSGVEGRGVGTEVMRSLVEASRQNGFNAIRSHFINPAMVTIAEKLASEGITGKPIYNAHFTSKWVVEPTTQEMLDNPGLSDPVEAALSAAQGSDTEDSGGTLCVLPLD